MPGRNPWPPSDRVGCQTDDGMIFISHRVNANREESRNIEAFLSSTTPTTQTLRLSPRTGDVDQTADVVIDDNSKIPELISSKSRRMFRSSIRIERFEQEKQVPLSC